MKRLLQHRLTLKIHEAFFAATLLFFLTVGTACGFKSNENTPSRVPDFSLPYLIEGTPKAVFTEINKKSPALLIFWASWCPSCVEEIPKLNEFHQKFSAEGLEILAVNVQESRSDVKKFAAHHAIMYPILLDEEGEVANKFGLVGLPVAVFVAKGGEVLYYGFSLPGNMDQLLEKGRV